MTPHVSRELSAFAAERAAGKNDAQVAVNTTLERVMEELEPSKRATAAATTIADYPHLMDLLVCAIGRNPPGGRVLRRAEERRLPEGRPLHRRGD